MASILKHCRPRIRSVVLGRWYANGSTHAVRPKPPCIRTSISFYSNESSKKDPEKPCHSAEETGEDAVDFQWPVPDAKDDHSATVLSKEWLNPVAPVDGQTFDNLSYQQPKVETVLNPEEFSDFSIPESVVHILDSMKAQNVSHYHKIRKEADDIFVATGLSRVHQSSLADALYRAVKRKGKANVEGRADGDWILIDAGKTLVHIFSEECREEYDLDELYSLPPINLEEIED